jgi:hypothetical protein
VSPAERPPPGPGRVRLDAKETSCATTSSPRPSAG